VVGFLVAIAIQLAPSDARHVRTACDIIHFVQIKYYRVDFSYLTPQYILDWYNLLGQNIVFRGSLRTESFNDTLLSNSEHPQLVHIERRQWTAYILEPRRDRLLLTGYDHVL